MINIIQMGVYSGGGLRNYVAIVCVQNAFVQRMLGRQNDNKITKVDSVGRNMCACTKRETYVQICVREKRGNTTSEGAYVLESVRISVCVFVEIWAE